MLDWITENLSTIVVSLILVLVVAAIIRKLVRDKKKGKSSCGCNCAHCAMNQETARALVSGIHAPLNLILNGVYHDFAGLAKLGVRRLSTGSGPVRYLCEETMKMAEKIKDGDVDAVLQSTFSYAKANAFFQK